MYETKLKHYLLDLTVLGIAGWYPPSAPSTLYLLLLEYLPHCTIHMVAFLSDWGILKNRILFYPSLNLQSIAQWQACKRCPESIY